MMHSLEDFLALILSVNARLLSIINPLIKKMLKFIENSLIAFFLRWWAM